MPDTHTRTINSMIPFRGHWLTLVPEMALAGGTTWILIDVAKASG